MIDYIWSKEIDKATKENIENSIKLQIINVYLKDIRPLTVNLKLTNDMIEGNITDSNKNILKEFHLSGNKHAVIITVSGKADNL